MEPLSGPKKIVPNPQGVHLRHLALHMGGRGGSSPSAVPSLGSAQPKVTLLTPLRQRGWGCTPKHPNPPSPVGSSSPGEAQIPPPGRQQEVCLAPSMEQVTRALPQAPSPRRSNPPVWPRQQTVPSSWLESPSSPKESWWHLVLLLVTPSLQGVPTL